MLAELRPHLTAELLAAVYADGHPQGLRYTAADGDVHIAAHNFAKRL